MPAALPYAVPLAEPADIESTLTRVAWRLAPMLGALYVLGYLDRINISFAHAPMAADLHLSESQYGLGSGIFYIGYCLFEVPSNLILERVGARRWIARIMVTWGIISSSMMFIVGPRSFYLVRFLLGAAEAGFFPGIVLYLTYWFPSRRRAQIVAAFLTATALAGVIGAPLSGPMLHAAPLLARIGITGLHGWQCLFLLEGIPSIVVGFLVLFLLVDKPAKARWLSPAERQAVQEALIDSPAASGENTHRLSAALASGRLWVMCALYFMLMIGLYGFTYFIPKYLQVRSQWGTSAVGYLCSIPYCAAAGSMVFVARSSDRTGERRWHLALSALTATVGFGLMALSPGVWTATIGSTIAAVGVWGALGPFWAIPTAYLRGTAAAGGIAIINSLGCLGGFLAPYMIGGIADATRSYAGGWMFVGAAMACGAGIVLSTRPARPLPT